MAVQEAASLRAVEWDIGVVEIEHDLARRTLVGFEKQRHQQRIDLRPSKRLVSPAFSDTDGCAEVVTLQRSIRSSLRRC